MSSPPKSVQVPVVFLKMMRVSLTRSGPSATAAVLHQCETHRWAPWAIFYVQVDDVKAAIAQAESLGASVAVPFVDNGTIEFAHLLDPQGSRFGVWRPKQPT